MAFPEKEFQIMVILNREDKTNKAFYVYEIFNDRMSRKINRPFALGDDSDAFDADIDGKTLIYSVGDELIFQSLQIPEVM